jgi:uncharacterized protein YndB with AHSA1/START domain
MDDTMTPSAPRTYLERPSDREFQLTRLLDAPRDLVWEVLTDAAHAALWFGPEGFATTTHEFDFRVGGVWRFTMHDPDGVDYHNKQLFREIIPGERVVYYHTGGLEHEDEGGFVSAITLAAEGKKTRITLRTLFPSAEILATMTERFGVVEGGKEHLGRLARYLALPRAERTIVLSRLLPASREQVWEAWTTADGLRRWFSPGGSTASRAEVDLRVGGRWSVTFRNGDGEEHDNGGRYLEISPQDRLVFSWILESAPGQIVMEAHQYVALHPGRGETRLTFVSRIITALPGSEEYTEGAPRGWSEAFAKLATALQR